MRALFIAGARPLLALLPLPLLAAVADPQATPFRFREPAPTAYVLAEPAGGSASGPGAEWVKVRRADGTGDDLELGRRIVLAVEPGVDPASLTAGLGLARVRFFSEGIEIWEAPDALAAASAAAVLAGAEGVRAAYPVMRRDHVLHTPYASRPRDTLYPRQWHLENRAPNGRPRGADVNARAAWPVTRGAGVAVAVADNGVDVGHLDLVGRTGGQPHFNFANSTATPLGTAEGDHGTAVAGLIGATAENNRGVAGVAPEASLASLVIFTLNNQGLQRIVPDDALADSFRYRTDRIQVQNHSWGSGAGLLRPEDALSDAAIREATSTGRSGLGTVIIRSAGNAREDLGNANDDGYAADPRVVAVAATRLDGRVAAYSSPGACILVSGPSGDPRADGTEDPAAPNLVTTDRRGTAGYNTSAGESGDYGTGTSAFNGTSASAPVVAGVAALVLSARPDLGYRDVHQILALAARQYDLADPDLRTNGAALWVSHNQGFGVPDAGLAVGLAKRWVKRPSSTRTRVVRNGTVAIPDDSFRLVLTGTLPANLRNLRVLPSMGLYPDGGTAPVPLISVGLGNTNLPASVAGRGVLIAGGVNTFSNKIQRATAAGATLAVIYGDQGGTELEVMSGTSFAAIPAVYLSQTDGENLARAVGSRTNLTARIQTTPAAVSFSFEESVLSERVGVRVRSNHAARGDLRVTLVSPSGTRSVLQNVNDDISPGPVDWTYWSTQHLLEPARGTWRLEVTDLWAFDEGSLLGAELIVDGVRIEDSDNDGLEDSWERRWFGGLDRGPADDVRGDGLQLVRWQHLEGSPVDGPLLFPRSVAVLDGAQVRATFPAPLGRRYILDSSEALGGAATIYTNAPGRVGWLEILLPLGGRDERWIGFRPEE